MKSRQREEKEIPVQEIKSELPEKLDVIQPEKPTKGGFYIVGDQVQDANGNAIPGWSVVNGEAVWSKP